MSEVCVCSYALGNMGIPDCSLAEQEAKYLIFANYQDSAGAIQGIDLTDTIDQAYWDARFQRYDSSDALVNELDRWYKTVDLKNPERTQADSIYQEFNDQTRYNVQRGRSTFMALITFKDGIPLGYVQQLNKLKCPQDIGFLIVDQNDTIIGNAGTSGFLNFIKIAPGSFDFRPVPPTGGNTKGAIMITFDIDRSEYDSQLGGIKVSDTTVSVSAITNKPLINVTGAVVGDETITTFAMQINAQFGSAINPTPVEHLVAADFYVHNVTDDTEVTPSSVVESSSVPGLYTFTFTTQASDVLSLRVVKNGIDSTLLEAVVITIPAT